MKEGWTYKKIGDICDVKTGKLDANASDENGAYPFFTCSKEPLRINSFSYDAECVLIAGNGDLNVKYYNGKFDAYQRTYILTIKKDITDISVHYLYLFFLLYVDVLRKNSIGGVIKYIKLGDIADAKIHIPPLSEQERIVSELDLLSSIIEKKKEQLKEYDKLAQSIFYDMFGDPIDNPKGWEVKQLEEVIYSTQLGLIRSAKMQSPENRYLYFKMNNITSSGQMDLSNITRINASSEEIDKYSLKDGDFLFNTRNSYELVGKTCVFSNRENDIVLYNNNILRITFNNKINSIYIAYLFNDVFVKKQLNGIKKGTTSVWAIYYIDLAHVKVLIPPFSLQQSFAEKIEAIEKQKALVQQSISETQTLFDSTMDKYFG